VGISLEKNVFSPFRPTSHLRSRASSLLFTFDTGIPLQVLGCSCSVTESSRPGSSTESTSILEAVIGS
jgi:hypothetical protein